MPPPLRPDTETPSRPADSTLPSDDPRDDDPRNSQAPPLRPSGVLVLRAAIDAALAATDLRAAAIRIREYLNAALACVVPQPHTGPLADATVAVRAACTDLERHDVGRARGRLRRARTELRRFDAEHHAPT